MATTLAELAYGRESGKRKIQSPRRYVVLYEYVKRKPDELDLKMGDIVMVCESFSDGWMRGIRMPDMKIGVFPGNFAKPFPKPGEHIVEGKRTKVVKEILSTEMTYGRTLWLLSENFAEPLKASGVVPSENYGSIFGHTQALEKLNEDLVDELRLRMLAWDEERTLYGDIFVIRAPLLKLFESYAMNFAKCREVIEHLQKLSKGFRKFCQVAEAETGQTLHSLLMGPIQRAPRYELLLKELVKNTDPGHPDFVNLETAVGKVLKINKTMNENMRRVENDLKIVQIAKSFQNDDVRIIEENRKFRKVRGAGNDKETKSSKDTITLRKRKRLSTGSVTDLKPPSAMSASKSPRIRSASHKEYLETSPVTSSLHLDLSTDISLRPKSGSPINSTARLSYPGSESPSTATSPTSSLSSLQGAEVVRTVSLDSDSLQRSGRRFHREGNVYVTANAGMERYLFLFNDVLLISNVVSRKNKTYKLKERVVLSQAWVQNGRDYSTSLPAITFVLGTPQQIHNWVLVKVEEKNGWLQELRTLILEQKELVLVPAIESTDLPDAVFCTTTFKSRTSLRCGVPGELEIFTGDEVIVVGLENMAGRWQPILTCFDRSDMTVEWWFGISNGNGGWFPASLIPTNDQLAMCNLQKGQLKPLSIAHMLQMKETWLSLTKKRFPPLGNPRTAKVFDSSGSFKTMRIGDDSTVSELISSFLHHGLVSKPEQWQLCLESVDGSYSHMVSDDEPLAYMVDMWGQGYRNQMRFVLRPKVATT